MLFSNKLILIVEENEHEIGYRTSNKHKNSLPGISLAVLEVALITISVHFVRESIRTGEICAYYQTTVQNYRRENNTKQESRKND